MNDYLIMYIERGVTLIIDNMDIMQQFQSMKYRIAIIKIYVLRIFFLYLFL